MQHLGKKFDFVTAKNWFMGIVQLKHTVMQEVAKNENSGPAALVVFALGLLVPALVGALGGVRVLNVTVRPDMGKVLFGTLLLLAITVLGLLVVPFIAERFFKAKASFGEFFRVMGFAYGLNILNVLGSVFPYFLGSLVGMVVAVWLLVIAFHALKALFHLDDTNAALTLVTAVLVHFVLSGMVAALGFSLVTGSSAVSGVVLTY